MHTLVGILVYHLRLVTYRESNELDAKTKKEYIAKLEVGGKVRNQPGKWKRNTYCSTSTGYYKDWAVA
jgi:hypothetical protein